MKPGKAIIPCPVCREATVLDGQVRGYPLRRCPTCGHRYFSVELTPQHVNKVYDDGYFFGGGVGYPDYTASRDSLVDQGRHYGRLLKRFASPGCLIDVGAAAGFLTSGFRKEGWDAFGIEPNRLMAAYAREKVGVDVRIGSVESFETATPVQAVAVVQVLAHLRDPVVCLKKIRSWLQPDGVLLLETWDSNSLTAKWSGSRWHQLSPPSVLHLFNRRTLGLALAASGFRIERVGFRLKWIRVGHGRELLRHSRAPDSAFVRALSLLPKNLSLPYPGDDLIWCVARRVGASLRARH